MFSHSPGGGTVWNVLERCRHPLATLFVIALAVRLIIMPLVSHDFDIYHWALVIENIQTGDELYGLDGYYYTPTWGYVLAFFSLIQDAFLWVDTFGLRVTELLPIEDLVFDDHMATATTIAFNMSLKVPMVIIDFLVAWLLYTLLMDMTGSRRKSLAGAALWLFCPVVIFMSSVQIQFDVLSALFMLLVVILLRKDRCFLAGMVLTTAILLKFFPAFTLFVLIGYVFIKHRGSGTVIRRLVSAAVGMGLMVVVLYLPTILDGNFMDSLFFMTGRLETQTSSGAFYEIGSFLLMAVGLIGMFVAGYRMFRTKPEDADKGLISNVLLSLTFAMFISIMPQYVLILMPFLIIVMLTSDGRMRLAWIIVSAGAMLTVLVSNNIMLLDTLAACTGIVSPGWVAEMAVAIETVRIGGYTLVTILGALGGVIECLGLVFILLLYLEDAAGSRIPRIAGALSKLKRWDFNEEQV